jgi:CHRD domain
MYKSIEALILEQITHIQTFCYFICNPQRPLLIGTWRQNAQTHKFISLLNTAQETVLCNSTGASGQAVITYDSMTMQFCYWLSHNGLSQAVETALHIHSPAPIGVAGPILFNMTPGMNQIACITVSKEADEASLFDDLWYINVHTDRCPGGELRGQILKVY